MNKYHHTVTQECTQSGTIGSIQQLIEQLSRLQIEERQERQESEKRIVSALEKIADQRARIINLETANTDRKHELDILFNAQRKIVEDPRLTTLYTFYQLTTNKYTLSVGITTLILVLIGSLNDLLYHTTIFSSITSEVIKLLK